MIDEEVDVFSARRLDHLAFPVCLDATTCIEPRINHRIISRPVVVAAGVTANDDREVLGVDVGDRECEVFRTAFLRGLKDRELGGASWQCCKVHLMRNISGAVAAASKETPQLSARSSPSPPRGLPSSAPRDRRHPRAPVPQCRRDPRRR